LLRDVFALKEIDMNRFMRTWLMVLAGALAAGCTRESTPPAPVAAADTPAADTKYLLAGEPAGAKGVIAVRREARDGDAVAVVGHIGGDAKPWVEGRAAFWVVDPSIKPCPADEGCPTPWDCCCTPREELVQAMATVKVVDAQGRTVPVDARKLLGLKESQTVVVRGKALRDDHGNLTVLADGLFVRH
jgi:hypothetical protein